MLMYMPYWKKAKNLIYPTQWREAKMLAPYLVMENILKPRCYR